MLIDLRNKGITGKDLETKLDNVGITVNKNSVPFDTEKPSITSGIRIGTPAVTTRGFKEDDMKEIACDYIGFSNREENRKISAASVAEMIYCFNQLALVDNDLILEANFRKEEIDQILSIAEENGYVVPVSDKAAMEKAIENFQAKINNINETLHPYNFFPLNQEVLRLEGFEEIAGQVFLYIHHIFHILCYTK